MRITPRECLLMTLPEIAIILEEGIDFQNEKIILHADMKTSVLNAPHFYKKSQEPYRLYEFIPKQLANDLKQDARPEDQARLIQERGDALAEKCRRLKDRR